MASSSSKPVIRTTSPPGKACAIRTTSPPGKASAIRTPSACTCPVCDFGDIDVFVTIPQVPVHCNLLWAAREEALNAPRGDVQLGFCGDCGHVFNVAFDSNLMEYAEAYENSLHFSPRFQQYAESLAVRLIEHHDLHGKDIIEIGSGQGDFLKLLCELGGNRGVGFDPSYVDEPNDVLASGQVTFIPDFYSESYASYQADLVCCRHVLEHVERPRSFLDAVRRAIGGRLGTVVYFEVPNVMFTLRELGIWDIIYEHCSYFSSHSLACLFAQCDFQTVEITEAFAGQFLGIEALPSYSDPSGEKPGSCRPALDELAHDVAVFATRYRDKVEGWQRKLEAIANAGQRVVVWGAGSKGVTFLNTLTQDQIEYVVDINPRKQGMHIAGTGQRIVPPEFLRDYQPDLLVVMNRVYEHEIQGLVRTLGLTVELLGA